MTDQTRLERIHNSGNRFRDKDTRKNNKLEHVCDSKNCNRALASPLPLKGFMITAAINFIWINISEVFRYFTFVMPMMREALPQIENVAPMNLIVFAIWGIWDTLLVLCVTGAIWVFLDKFGPTARNAILAASFMAASIFAIFWLGLYNMNLATGKIALLALSLAWVEIIIAGLIVLWGMRKFNSRD